MKCRVKVGNLYFSRWLGEDALMIEYDSPYCNDCFEREYEISFCPMCGRKLEV